MKNRRKNQLIVGSLVLLVTCAGLGVQGANGLPSAERNPSWREAGPNLPINT